MICLYNVLSVGLLVSAVRMQLTQKLFAEKEAMLGSSLVGSPWFDFREATSGLQNDAPKGISL